MSRKISQARKQSNPAADKIVGKTRQDCRWFEPALQELERLFPSKTAQELALRADRSVRVCEKWLSRQCAPDGGAVHALLNSNVGDRVVLALTRSCTEPWVKDIRRSHEISQLRKLQSETRRRLEALERGSPE